MKLISRIVSLPGGLISLLRRGYRRGLMCLLRPCFHSYGRNFVFDAFGTYSFKTISVGDDVYIGPGALITSPESSITIGCKVMFGPNVSLLGGDHNTSVIGQFMYDIHDKRPEDDQPIEIEDDVWIGCGATVLKGVTVGRGSIVAAGALVTTTIPPYTIVGGIPAKVLKTRWPIEEILEHELALYPPEERLEKKDLYRKHSENIKE